MLFLLFLKFKQLNVTLRNSQEVYEFYLQDAGACSFFESVSVDHSELSIIL